MKNSSFPGWLGRSPLVIFHRVFGPFVIRHFLWVACVLFGPAAGQVALAVPADGSYEGDVRPHRAAPAWKPGYQFSAKSGKPSLITWSVLRNGALVQKPGAPGQAGMYLDPVPIVAGSYTVEIRFKITKCNMTTSYSHPLMFYISRKGGGYHGLHIGQKKGRDYVLAALVLEDEWQDETTGNFIVESKWLRLRVTVESHIGQLKVRVFLDGKQFQDIATAQTNARAEYFCIWSDPVDDAWEIDYVRWKNAALVIDTPLERALTAEERTAQEEQELVRKLKELLK